MTFGEPITWVTFACPVCKGTVKVNAILVPEPPTDKRFKAAVVASCSNLHREEAMIEVKP